MFAPHTIDIRYGDNGALAAGAAGAGRAAGYAQQKALDMQTINEEANRQTANFQQQQQLAAQQQAQQLQLAGQLAVARIRGNPTNTAARGNSPFTQAVQAAKQAALQSAVASGDLDANDPEANLAVSSPDINAEQLYKLIDSKKKAKATQETTDADTKAKQAVVAAAADTIDPNDAETIKSYVSDPKLTIEGLRKVITESQRRREGQGKATQQVQNRALTQQLQQTRTAGQQALNQAKAIEKDHPEINFQGPPSQFGPDEQDSLAVYVEHQKLVMAAKSAAARGEALAGGNAAYEEGTVLHSPSTGRIFKVVNGQLQEITSESTQQ